MTLFILFPVLLNWYAFHRNKKGVFLVSNNKNLQKAKDEKNDEFYTLLSDIEKELIFYKDKLKDKIIYCNCDNPEWSNFYKYFKDNFHILGIKKLISTYYGKKAYKTIYDGIKEEKELLKGNGDFKSKECIDILKESDIIITNPAFSCFRDFMTVLIENKKQFLIIGNMNALTYKKVFPLIRDDKIWLGCVNGSKEYIVPESYAKENPDKCYRRDKVMYTKFGNTVWFTNIDHDKRHAKVPLDLSCKYEGHEKDYPKYDNYDAIEVSKVNNIPCDYKGVMGVPVSFINKYCPEQFRIIGISDMGGDDIKEMEAIRISEKKEDSCKINGEKIYKRIFIKRVIK